MTFENAVEAAEFIRSKYDHPISTAVVLGSGLGAFADELENSVRIPYEQIPHFVKSTVAGHSGQLVLGEIDAKHIAVQQGRFHYYEGYSME
jgi:purine-nucleoside phosphorylase